MAHPLITAYHERDGLLRGLLHGQRTTREAAYEALPPNAAWIDELVSASPVVENFVGFYRLSFGVVACISFGTILILSGR